jgi:spore coat protein U-like protein
MKKINFRTVGYAHILSASILMVAASPAFAAEDTSTLDVSATVTSNCVIGTTALAFGSVDVTSGANVDGEGGISVTCTSGTAWTATADIGVGTGATMDSRKMMSGANLLDYSIYTDVARSTVWGDGAVTADITGTGTGVVQETAIYGRVPLGQSSLPAGAYTDTVTVTVTY